MTTFCEHMFEKTLAGMREERPGEAMTIKPLFLTIFKLATRGKFRHDQFWTVRKKRYGKRRPIK